MARHSVAILKGSLSLVRPDALMGGVIWFLFGYHHAVVGKWPLDDLSNAYNSLTCLFCRNFSASIRPEFVISFLAVVAAVGSGLIVNQVFDREVDRANAKPLPLVDGSVTINHAWIELIALLMFAALCSAMLSKSQFVLFLLTTVVGFSYSVPPFRLKARPVVDAACFALTYGLLVFLFGWISWSVNIDIATLQTALPYVMLAFVIHIVTAIEDADGDRKCNCRTTAVAYGTATVLLLGSIMLVMIVAISAYLRNPITLIISLVSLPFGIYALLRPNLASVLLLCRVLGLLSLGIPFLLFPWIGALFLLILYLWGKVRFGSLRSTISRRR